MLTAQINTVTYNPAARAFDARVTITEGGEVFTYPCSLRAPMDTDTTIASRQLVELAKKRHARDARLLVSRRPENILNTHIPAEVTHATDALWQRMLGRAA